MKETFVSKDFSSFHTRKFLLLLLLLLFYFINFILRIFNFHLSLIRFGARINETINLAIFRLPIDFLFHSMIVRYQTMENWKIEKLAYIRLKNIEKRSRNKK